MTDYPYTKTPVDVPRLRLEILAEDLITKTLNGVSFSTPNSLNISFTETLSGEEETALDAVVTAHDGSSVPVYARYCEKCRCYFVHYGLSAPTVCPHCGSSNISSEANGQYTPWLLDIFSTSGVSFPNNDSSFCHIGGAGAITGTEALAQNRMPKGRAVAVQGYCANSSGDFTIRKNGVDTTITGTVNSVGQFRLTGGSGKVDFAAGDLLSVSYDSGIAFTVYGIQVEYECEVV